MNTRIRRINIEKLDFSTIISDEQSEINDADNTQINGILHNYHFIHQQYLLMIFAL